MHELSLAIRIVEIAEEELVKHGGGRVLTTFLKLGAMANVSRDALLFSYPAACEGTQLEGSTLSIQEISDGNDLHVVALEVE